jgi:thiol-disulfide isomerase/thioredoxin
VVRPTDSARAYLPRLAALGLAASLLAACGPISIGLPSAVRNGRAMAPRFAFTTFDGRWLSSNELAGQAVVLNFLASWCTPCRAELPYFETTSRAYAAQGVVFIGLAVQDGPTAAMAFLQELGGDLSDPPRPKE